MTTRARRTAAAAGAVTALISIITSLAVPAGVLSGNSSPAWNTTDLVTEHSALTLRSPGSADGENRSPAAWGARRQAGTPICSWLTSTTGQGV
jgi:hypothetical protein